MPTLLEAVSPAATFLMGQGVSATAALAVVTLATGIYTGAVVAWFRR